MEHITDRMALYNGDCVQVIKKIPDESVHFQVFSPPFANLYIYSDDLADMGNCKNSEQFFEQFDYLIPELYRILKQGRMCAVHCKDLVKYKGRDGAAGIYDFSGDIIKHFEKFGFQYHSRVTIWKDPVIEMQRTKAHGLLWKQLRKDSTYSRMGMPDYILIFRKWGEDVEPVTHTKEGFPVQQWQQYASPAWEYEPSPVWWDIQQTNVLNAKIARDDKDEKHICFAEGTLILTQRGYVPIESVEIGKDKTLTHTGTWKSIIAKALTKENAEVIQTVACGVPLLISTPEHKLYAKKKLIGKKAKLHRISAEWIEAQNCEKSYLCQQLPPEISSPISSLEWWIIGRYLADGHVDGRGHQFFLSIGANKYEEFCNKANRFIGAVYKKENCYQIGLVNLSNEARDILKKCGKHAYGKVLPIEVISLNKELSESLLTGYLSGDGHNAADGKISATSVSRALLLGMAIVVLKARGKIASIYKGRPEHQHIIQGRQVNAKQEWIMTFSPNYSFSLFDGVSAWKKVKRIDKAENCNVWSIQVEDDASYTAEGCIVKNCPLQLDVIERLIELYTNPDDTVFTPFLGIGSEAYTALRMGRKAIGIELKDSYFNQSVTNCSEAIEEDNQTSLFE